MKFSFRLQKLLEFRTRREEEAQRDYMNARAETMDALRRLDDMYRAIDAARERSQGLIARGSKACALTAIDSFIDGQKQRIEEQRRLIRKLKENEEQRQDVLIEMSKEKKTLEKLKENKRREFDEELERRERMEYDDLMIMRHGRGEGP